MRGLVVASLTILALLLASCGEGDEDVSVRPTPPTKPTDPSPTDKREIAEASSAITAYCSDQLHQDTDKGPSEAVDTLIREYRQWLLNKFRFTPDAPETNMLKIVLDANEALAGECDRPLASKLYRAMTATGHTDDIYLMLHPLRECRRTPPGVQSLTPADYCRHQPQP